MSALQALNVAQATVTNAVALLGQATRQVQEGLQFGSGALDYANGTVGALSSAIELLDTETPRTLRAEASAMRDNIEAGIQALSVALQQLQSAMLTAQGVQERTNEYLGKLQSQ